MENIPEHLQVLKHELDIQNFVKGGSCGAVFKAAWQGKGLNAPIAIKMVRSESAAIIAGLCTELATLSSIRFRNTCQVFGACRVNANELWLVLEYVDGPNLRDFLFAIAPLPLEQQIRFSVQAAKALYNLHHSSSPMLHKDIKSQSFLVKNRSELILTGFGLSKLKSISESRSYRWAAPEVLAGAKIWSEKADIYSLGMVFYEIVSGNIPFYKLKSLIDITNSIKRGKRPKIPQHCPKKFANIIRQCWDPIPNKRPTMEDVVEQLTQIEDDFRQQHAPFETTMVVSQHQSLLNRIVHSTLHRNK